MGSCPEGPQRFDWTVWVKDFIPRGGVLPRCAIKSWEGAESFPDVLLKAGEGPLVSEQGVKDCREASRSMFQLSGVCQTLNKALQLAC